MKKSTTNNTISTILIILSASTALMIYLSVLRSVAFDHDLYMSEFEKHNVYCDFGGRYDIDNESALLIDYIRSGEGGLDSEFYNQKEKDHMVEVRQLFRTSGILLDIAVIVSIFSLALLIIIVKNLTANMSKKRQMAWVKNVFSNLLISIGAVVDIIAVLFILLSLTFSTSFFRFHQLLFSTDTWMLNPATDNLIRMFPEAFFFDIFARIILFSLISGTILLAIGVFIKLGKPKILRT